MGSCGCSVFCLLFFENQAVLVGLTQVWCYIAVRVLNMGLSVPLGNRCTFLQLTSNAYACISTLILVIL